MTSPTDELTRLLTQVADDLVERAPVAGPDTTSMWRRGRRVTWAARAAAAGILAVVMLVLVTGGVLRLGGAPATLPAGGDALTYPKVVSDMFPRELQLGAGPIFGLVATSPTASEPDDTLVIERVGVLATLRTGKPSSGEVIVLSSDGAAPPALAPDGTKALTTEGIVDVTDGFVTRPLASDPVIQSASISRGVWSPDSQHVLVDTVDGPVVVDAYAQPVLSPAAGDQAVRAAGWLDATTVLGVRQSAGGEGGALDIVTRELAEPQWATVSTVAADAVHGSIPPSKVFAAPDGSRLLLVYPTGSGPSQLALINTRTGTPVAFAGESPSIPATWDDCDPVWQAGQPLNANGGLSRPTTGESVMSFSGHRHNGCVTLAGNELTGSPAPGAAGARQERAWETWRAALPFGGVLALIGVVWMVIALRRSRRHGETFLPMIPRLPF